MSIGKKKKADLSLHIFTANIGIVVHIFTTNVDAFMHIFMMNGLFLLYLIDCFLSILEKCETFLFLVSKKVPHLEV